jgi:hypothetical protein
MVLIIKARLTEDKTVDDNWGEEEWTGDKPYMPCLRKTDFTSK